MVNKILVWGMIAIVTLIVAVQVGIYKGREMARAEASETQRFLFQANTLLMSADLPVKFAVRDDNMRLIYRAGFSRPERCE